MKALRGRQSGVDSSHRKLLLSKAMAVNVAEKSGRILTGKSGEGRNE
jgi:hypothetical protein